MKILLSGNGLQMTDRALLFMGNYYNEEQTGKVTYTHPETGEKVPVPYSQEGDTMAGIVRCPDPGVPGSCGRIEDSAQHF